MTADEWLYERFSWSRSMQWNTTGACLFHILFSHTYLGIQCLGQGCFALLYLLKATWCKVQYSLYSEAGKLAHEMDLAMAVLRIRTLSPTQTNLTTQPFKLISLNCKLYSIFPRSNGPQNHEYKIVFLYHHHFWVPFWAACRFLYFLTSWAHSLISWWCSWPFPH